MERVVDRCESVRTTARTLDLRSAHPHHSATAPSGGRDEARPPSSRRSSVLDPIPSASRRCAAPTLPRFFSSPLTVPLAPHTRAQGVRRDFLRLASGWREGRSKPTVLL